MKVNIKGVDYKIELKEILVSDDSAVGITIPLEKTIGLKLNQKDIDSTLLHELIHAYFYECGLIEQYRDESLTYWLEYNIPQIMKTYQEILTNRRYKKINNE